MSESASIKFFGCQSWIREVLFISEIIISFLIDEAIECVIFIFSLLVNKNYIDFNRKKKYISTSPIPILNYEISILKTRAKFSNLLIHLFAWKHVIINRVLFVPSLVEKLILISNYIFKYVCAVATQKSHQSAFLFTTFDVFNPD